MMEKERGMSMDEKENTLCQYILAKDTLKRKVAENTSAAFALLRDEAKAFFDCLSDLKEKKAEASELQLSLTDRGKTEFMLAFSSDVLLFSQHTNVFEFSRNHEVMKTPYIKEDPERSYCGLIHIYNFLSDSLLYHRENDLGYLIGRVFVNKDGHYFIEGKQELGLIYTNFGHAEFNQEAARTLLRSAMEYTAKFDLLTPPYDEVKEITVGNIQDELAYKKMRTAKRLGFQFKADEQ